MVHTDVNYLYEATGTVSPAPAARGAFQGHCFAELWMGNRISVSSVAVRREALERVGLFDEHIRRPTAQDYDLWLRLSRSSMFGFVNEPLVTCRMHMANASRDKIAMLEDVLYVLEKSCLQFPELHSLLGTNVISRRLAIEYEEIARHYCSARRFHDARRAIGRCLQKYPSNVKAWVLFFSTFVRPMFSRLSTDRSL